MLPQEELNTRFTYHKPKEDQPEKYTMLRDNGHWLAELINKICPDSREKSLAITKIEEAIFWANASIARRS